jgi:hypothetical protein
MSIPLLFAFLAGCDPLSSDQDLISHLSRMRPELERIRQMIEEDNLNGRIHADYADPRLPPARLEQ